MDNLRDRDSYRDAAWDWSCLEGCFGKTIRPTDVDGLVERNGHILMFEAKGPRGTLGEGQRLAFARFSAKPLQAVIVFWGERETLEVTRIVLFYGGQQQGIQPASFDRFRAMATHWFQHADSGSGEEVDWQEYIRQG